MAAVSADSITFVGRVAIVTGGGRGLGRAYATELASRGAAVVVHDSGAAPDGRGASVEPAQSTVDEITSAGGRAVACTVDGSTPQGGQEVVDLALAEFGHLDSVVANAGTITASTYPDCSPTEFEALLRHHLAGAFHVTRPAFAAMKARGYGRLVFISSAAGVFGRTELVGYAAAKTGMIGLMNTAALEGSEFGITANAVMPMGDTRMAEALLGDAANTPEARAFLATLRVDQVAPVVAYLASAQCTLTRTVLSAFAGHVAAVKIGVTPGWSSDNGNLSAEDVRDNLDVIVDPSGTWYPADMSAEIAQVTAQAVSISRHSS